MQFLFGKRKIKVTKEEFAEVLLLWLTRQVNREAITRDAKIFDLQSEDEWQSREAKELFGLNLANKKEFTVLIEELVILNMWIIVRACERVFDDVNKRDDCLDIFHKIVFERLIKEDDEEFEQWHFGLADKYVEYSKAVDAEPSSNAMLNLTSVVYRNLHGDAIPDAFTGFEIGAYVAESIKALEEAIKQYKVK